MAETRQCNLRIPVTLLEQIDILIALGEFEDRSEFIKYAMRTALRDYYKRGQALSPEVRG